MGKIKEMRLSIQSILIMLFNNMGMNAPQNIEEITDFVMEDVQECADPNDWHSGDVAIAFRRWIEAQAQPETHYRYGNVQPKTIGVIGLGDQLQTVGELRKLMSDLDANDVICIQTIDLQTGDAEDLYPMNLDVIEGIELNDGSIVREVRFCQMMNSAPDTRDKQPVINALVAQVIRDSNFGDTTVIDEVLQHVPYDILLHSLPEEDWVKYQQKYDAVLIPVSDNIWSEIKSEYVDDGYIFIDAWLTPDDNEGGSVIAKIYIESKEVLYNDDRAKTDRYAQEVIQEALNRI